MQTTSPKKIGAMVSATIAAILLLSGCKAMGASAISSGSSQDLGNQTYITAAGSYTFSGDISESIIVEVSKEDEVEIILDNASVSSSTNSPIYIIEAKDVKITLVENSSNTVTDNRAPATEEASEEAGNNAAIYSKADLKIKGEDGSSLTVIGNYKDGITGKDDLDFKKATVTITAKDDGIIGKDSVEIDKSTLTINAEDDAIRSDNTEDETKGVITVEDSTISIIAGDDGITAVQAIEILSGTIDIQESYEGIEAKKITIHDGEINIVSKDDGLNVAEKKAVTESTQNTFTESGMRRGNRGMGGGGDMFAVLEGGELNIYGGTITINSGGDGFDSNGNAVMTGGTLIVNGPTNNGNGPIDVNGNFEVSGGTIIAVGSSGMAETPDESSTQYAIQVNFDQALTAGTVVSLKDSSGNEIFSFTPEKQFQSVTYSSDKIQYGETYSFLVNGENYTTLTIESMITKQGTGGGMGMGGGNMGMRENRQGMLTTDPTQMPAQNMQMPAGGFEPPDNMGMRQQ